MCTEVLKRCLTCLHPHTPALYAQDEELPFELAILETGLGEACSFLAREADLLQVLGLLACCYARIQQGRLLDA